MDKYIWNFDEFCKSDKDFYDRLDKLSIGIKKIKDKKINDLYDTLKSYFALALEREKLYTYAELNSDIKIGEEKYIKMKEELDKVYNNLKKYQTKIVNYILSLNKEKDELINKDKRLKEYDMYLYEVLRNKRSYITNDKIIDDTNKMHKINEEYKKEIENADYLYENNERINISGYNKLSKDVSREEKEKLFDKLLLGLKTVNKSVSKLFIERVKLCLEISKEKKYKDSLEETLIDNDLPNNIVDNLIEVTNDNINLLRKYEQIVCKNNNIEKYNYLDKLETDIKFNMEYEDAVEDVKEALKILGKDYVSKLDKVFNSNSIDVYPRKGKVNGGYNFRNYTKPMILMNYNGNYQSVSTVAHETGHAVNGIMIKEHEPYQNFYSSVFLSETASKTNEELLKHYYEKNKDMKKFILTAKINDFISSVYMQCIYLEFEKNVYDLERENKNITCDTLNNLFYNIFTKYFGKDSVTENIKYFWVSRLHYFYNDYRFYNYQYAYGLISSIYISENIIESKNDMLNKYIEFLKTGGSKSTKDSLKILGIDYSKKDALKEAFKYFDNLLNEYKNG